MAQFKFNTISRVDIERSQGGSVMLNAIDYDGDDNQIIVGVPGSGKTTVTLMRAERLQRSGRKFKVFTFQNLLLLSLKNCSEEQTAAEMHTFFKWYKDKYETLEASTTSEEMIEKMKDLPTYDEVLVDEGQDFESRVYDALLKISRKVTVGADNAQKIHPQGLNTSEILEKLNADKDTLEVRLEYNYRNTFEIYNFARHFLPMNMRVNNQLTLKKMPRGRGNLPVVFQVSDVEEIRFRLKMLLDDSGDRNIAVLCYYKKEVNFYADLISNLGFRCSKFHSSHHIDGEIENILVTTYKSAKGLEFQVVILPDMQNAMVEDYQTPEHYYVAGTRARESLFLLFDNARKPNYLNSFDTQSYRFVPSTGEKLAITKPIADDDDLPF